MRGLGRLEDMFRKPHTPVAPRQLHEHSRAADKKIGMYTAQINKAGDITALINIERQYQGDPDLGAASPDLVEGLRLLSGNRREFLEKRMQ